MGYTSYNKLYKHGRAIGKRFKVMTGKTRSEVKRKTISYNRFWNKLSPKSRMGMKAKMVTIKRR